MVLLGHLLPQPGVAMTQAGGDASNPGAAAGADVLPTCSLQEQLGHVPLHPRRALQVLAQLQSLEWAKAMTNLSGRNQREFS